MRCHTNVSKSLRRTSLVQRTRRHARCLLQLQLGICYTSHRTCKCGTRPFWWVRKQGRSPHAPSMAKNTFGPVGIPFIRGASGTRQHVCVCMCVCVCVHEFAAYTYIYICVCMWVCVYMYIYMCLHIYIYIYIYLTHSLSFSLAQLVGVVEYTDCFSAEGKTPNECPGYDTKQSDNEVQVMLELWGMQRTPSLPSFPRPLRPNVVAPDKSATYGLNRIKPWFEFTVFGIYIAYLC